MNQQENLPMLLRRKHIKEMLGISDTLYYRLITDEKLPTVYYNNRVYIHRDKFLELLNEIREGKQKI